ncbi:MAG TPA: hypothetical protein VH396_17220 [Chitinophagaceae bacterium]
MKKTQKWMISLAIASLVIALLSWNRHDYFTQADPPFFNNASIQNEDEFSQEANIQDFTGDDNWFGSTESDKKAPPAEDVLIQKIPGNNNHLLMMAFYSKENYSGQFVSIENGSHLVFRDDGKGYDKKAGDGFYTARVAADLNEFRQKALNMTAQMKKNNYRPIRFNHREMIVDPDADESFDIQKLDRGEVVSISGLTNALSELDPSNNGGAADAGTATLEAIRTHSVTITNLAVVEDPTRTWNSCTQKGNINGPWTFNTIMRQLASKDPAHIATDKQVSDFVKNWLGHWATNQIVNGDTVKARTTVNSKILTPWLSKSKSAGSPNGQLDMRFAPFKLLAIVDRFDLREGGVHGITESSVGEGRYVFGLINSTCNAALKMGIILEFGVNKPNTCDAKKAWAQQWVALKDLTIGSSQYNQALQNITDQYTLCGTNPGRPNQSSLDQLRTNENALAGGTQIWEMREFVVDEGGSGFLKQNTVAQNVADKYNAQVINGNVQRMVAYVNQNTAAIKADNFTVPLTWQGFPFLGGAAKLIIPTTGGVAFPTGQPPKPYHWDGTDASNGATFIRNNIARFNFSLISCWGCHGGETQTGFTHVDPVFYGTEATLSGFLTGRAGTGGAVDFDGDSTNDVLMVKDPALRPSASPTLRGFNDILRRARDLNTVTTTACGSILGISSELLFKPLNSVD